VPPAVPRGARPPLGRARPGRPAAAPAPPLPRRARAHKRPAGPRRRSTPVVPENPEDLSEEDLEMLQEQMDEDYEVRARAWGVGGWVFVCMGGERGC
jgi:hypothetical protein